MNFPLKYTDELDFYKPNDFEQQLFQEKLNKISSVKSLAGFHMKVKTKLLAGNITCTVEYTISLFEQNIIFLFAILFSLFFAYADNQLFSTLSAIAGVIFYMANLIYVSRKVKIIICETLGLENDTNKNKLWKEQQEWIKNNELCPACGEQKNPYSNKCINCGLFFSKKTNKVSNNNTTSNISFNYTLSNKKNKLLK